MGLGSILQIISTEQNAHNYQIFVLQNLFIKQTFSYQYSENKPILKGQNLMDKAAGTMVHLKRKNVTYKTIRSAWLMDTPKNKITGLQESGHFYH